MPGTDWMPHHTCQSPSATGSSSSIAKLLWPEKAAAAGMAKGTTATSGLAGSGTASCSAAGEHIKSVASGLARAVLPQDSTLLAAVAWRPGRLQLSVP